MENMGAKNNIDKTYRNIYLTNVREMYHKDCQEALLSNSITVILPFPLKSTVLFYLAIIFRNGINFKSSELMKSEIVLRLTHKGLLFTNFNLRLKGN